MIVKIGEEAQTLIISLWVLVILTVLAVSIGHRVSIGLRLSRYSIERLKAYSLARAGIQRGIVELEDDKNKSRYDSLDEAWSSAKDPLTNKPLFEEVEIRVGSAESFTLREPYDSQTYMCMTDEEHKIDINTASPELLLGLLEELRLEAGDVPEIVRYIRIWRGDNDPNLQAGADIFSNFKKKPLVAPEELLLILSFFYQNKGQDNFEAKAKDVYSSLRYLITSATTEAGIKVNINTASRAILGILARSKASLEQQRFIDTLVTHIINFRQGENGPFKEESDIEGFSDSELTETEEKNIFNNIKPFFTVESDYFRISSTGKAGRISKKVTAIYNRQVKKTVYWHED